MTMGYSNYEQLLATYAEWLNWLREKKASLLAQKARLSAGKRNQNEAALPVAPSGGEDYAHLAGLDGMVAAPSPAQPLPVPDEPTQPPDEEEPALEAVDVSDEEIVPLTVAAPSPGQDDQDELA
jgi:hypothetical protein